MSITQDGWTPLITAAGSGNCEIVTDLLALGVDVNAQKEVSGYDVSGAMIWPQWMSIVLTAVLIPSHE